MMFVLFLCVFCFQVVVVIRFFFLSRGLGVVSLWLVVGLCSGCGHWVVVCCFVVL